MTFAAFLVQIAIPLALLLGLLLAVETGSRVGELRRRRAPVDKAGDGGAIQGALLGLLGLLLGFSFAGAAGRFMERQDFITAEANAIGTAYLRADLLEQAPRAELQTALREYVAHRIEVSRSLQLGLQPEVLEQVEVLHRRIWHATVAGIRDQPSLAVVLLGPINEVIDLHAARVAASRKHLPGIVLGLLVVCSVLTLGVVGYSAAVSGRRHRAMSAMLAFLIAAAIWTTIDLDRPRIGFVQVSDRPLVDLALGP